VPRRARPATLQDVAREAGVSLSTASYALNGRGRVATATRERVQAVAARLDYQADPRGRALRVGESRSVGLLLPARGPKFSPQDLTAISFYSDFSAGAAEAATARGHALVLLPEPETPRDLSQFGLKGLLVCDPVPRDRRLAIAEQLELPVVSIEPEPGEGATLPAGSVGADNPFNTRLLLQHLADRGAGHVALVTPPLDWTWVRETRDAYRTWCEDRGVAPVVSSTPAGADVDELLRDPRIDAILAMGEHAAIRIVRTALSHGRRIPDDLLLAAGTDGHLVQTSEPPITAVDLRPREQARHAVLRLLAVCEGQERQPPLRLRGELRARSSTAAAR
jgi:DNA-binding LacI/PurR family transcriptional regulator